VHTRPRRRSVALVTTALALVAIVLLGACGSDDDDNSGSNGSETTDSQPASSSSEPVTLRLGYFGNTTHAPAIVGIEHGEFEKALGDNVTLKTSVFNAGPAGVEAIFGGALDASFIGPNPSINAYAQSNGDAVRVVSGTASGGAYLVVKKGLTAKGLKGKTLASPQLGNTQDVALRTWLKDQGYETDTAGGGDVKILPQDNAQTLDTFKAGQIDGAWVPEPWATRLITEGGGEVLVDEKDLWPDGKYVTTNLLVTTEFLDAHPDVVQQLITGLGDAIDFIKESQTEAEQVVADGIEKATGKPIKPELVTASFANIDFTLDPVPSSLLKGADNAQAVGLLDAVDNLEGIYELKELNAVLDERGEAEVKAP
jgi:NitT/TauT family transport system substrate-binding protein